MSKKNTESQPANACACGCGEQTSSAKSVFRQGHDARAKSALIKEFGKEQVVELLARFGSVAATLTYVAERRLKGDTRAMTRGNAKPGRGRRGARKKEG